VQLTVQDMDIGTQQMDTVTANQELLFPLGGDSPRPAVTWSELVTHSSWCNAVPDVRP